MMPGTRSPFTGYRQVDSFDPDEEYLSEDDVFYLTLDLGAVEPTLLPSSSTYRLIGLDTPTPFMQLSGSFFKGRHDALIGSELLFTEGKNECDKNLRFLTHVGITERRIQFKEVQLREKSGDRDIAAPAAGSGANGGVQGKDGDVGRILGSATEAAGKKGRKGRNKGKDKAREEGGIDDAMDTS